MTTANTVSGRYAEARQELTARNVILGLAFVSALGFGLVLLQDPMVHDSLHNFRHAAGIVCH